MTSITPDNRFDAEAGLTTLLVVVWRPDDLDQPTLRTRWVSSQIEDLVGEADSLLGARFGGYRLVHSPELADDEAWAVVHVLRPEGLTATAHALWVESLRRIEAGADEWRLEPALLAITDIRDGAKNAFRRLSGGRDSFPITCAAEPLPAEDQEDWDF